eukprot:CAMPEP_0194762168 /NCGR_PEP_ID=MMETSP0323_2-20130528/14805_1 /TAXON_ID=2866 ORGANISM="Crypthecodinium cohnii, Strain Seligo" /NCGR_SAMPLE_ID=MMETSP0323_2 /ASSEMBLY_ACC=CAM_ASM_000346 /LENGTH=80 /DNA_ID=CAMNT_0039684245 /DNA_START=41 /DNA_END=279 /DNA_ORIENTATION=-
MNVWNRCKALLFATIRRDSEGGLPLPCDQFRASNQGSETTQTSENQSQLADFGSLKTAEHKQAYWSYSPSSSSNSPSSSA